MVVKDIYKIVMKILITGSNGFLGTYFRNFNDFKEHKVIYGSTSKIEGCIQFQSLYSDILEKINKDSVDTIIHFAAIIPDSFNSATFKNTFLPNTEMLNNLTDFSIKRNVLKFIYISSFGSMQNPSELDIKDYYTLSKITGEHFCSIMNSKGIQAVSFRISSPYGEFMRVKNVLNFFVEKALKNDTIEVFGSGKREQNFIYAGDILNSIRLVIDSKFRGIYNIVSDKNISMLNLAMLIKNIVNSKSEVVTNIKPDQQENYKPCYSYEKAKNDFGFIPRYNIEQGLLRYINWIKRHENSADL